MHIIHSLTRDELRQACSGMEQPAYRADQIWRWLYVSRIDDWSQARNLPASFRTRLSEEFALDCAVPAETTIDAGGTQKVLVTLPDGDRVETVLIPADTRRTVCVSSQVGCRFACAFCASGQAGFRRNLEAGEMVGQVLCSARPTHVVFMGIGEPFDNYDAVLKAVRILNDPDGLAIGARRITISTVGIIPGIRRLMDEGLQVELSVSLHAPDNALRCKLMPVSEKYPLPELLKACRDYVRATRRIVTFEYTLIQGVNDAPRQAEALASLLSSLQCRVNLIPLSPVEEYGLQPATIQTAQLFMQELDRAGINATLRQSRGSAVKAACGQLRFGTSK